MQTLFSGYGTVTNVAMPKNPAGQPRGFAFVDMGSQAELDAAIVAVDGLEFGGREVKCTPSLPKDQLAERPQKPSESNNILFLFRVFIPLFITS